MANHGTRTRFNQGCTEGPEGTACDPCKKANRDYFKKYGQDKKAEQLGTVTKLTTADNKPVEQPVIGPVEAGVIATLDGLPSAAKRPDLVASARSMARLQDNPIHAAQQVGAAKAQKEIMDQLLKGSEKKSRLASVRSMTIPAAATGTDV